VPASIIDHLSYSDDNEPDDDASDSAGGPTPVGRRPFPSPIPPMDDGPFPPAPYDDTGDVLGGYRTP
jgi:hypothetical protein